MNSDLSFNHGVARGLHRVTQFLLFCHKGAKAQRIIKFMSLSL